MSSPSSSRMQAVLQAALLARPEGLREPLLLVLATTEDAAHVPLACLVAGVRPGESRDKLRTALRRIGATCREDDLRWTLRSARHVPRIDLWPLPRVIDALRAHYLAHGEWPTTREWQRERPEHPHYQAAAIRSAGGFAAVVEMARAEIVEEVAA